MAPLAFVYPGQGSQRVGMGAQLRESHPDLFGRYFGLADEVTGLPVSRSCLEGPIEALTRTDVAQPALFAHALAVSDYAFGLRLRPDFVAGHSLGEFTAAVACGALSLEEGMGLVAERGRLMADIQTRRPGTMAAVVGLSAEVVGGLCETASGQAGLVGLANLNTPSQIVVSGEESGVALVARLATEAGAEDVVRLKVGAGFHSPLMQPVQERLGEMMRALTWNDPQQPLVANVSGTMLHTGGEIQAALVAQTTLPVRWTACVTTLTEAGCRRFLELGPGRVLTGLVRQVDQEVEAFSADSPRRLQALVDAWG